MQKLRKLMLNMLRSLEGEKEFDLEKDKFEKSSNVRLLKVIEEKVDLMSEAFD